MAITHVAIWPDTAKRLDDYTIVPVEEVKHFSPRHAKDFISSKRYRYKPKPNEPSKAVFILRLGTSEEEVREKVSKSRIVLPSAQVRAQSELSATTDDSSQPLSQLCLMKETHSRGKALSAEKIVEQYKKKGVPGRATVSKKIGSMKKVCEQRSAEEILVEIDSASQSKLCEPLESRSMDLAITVPPKNNRKVLTNKAIGQPKDVSHEVPVPDNPTTCEENVKRTSLNNRKKTCSPSPSTSSQIPLANVALNTVDLQEALKEFRELKAAIEKKRSEYSRDVVEATKAFIANKQCLLDIKKEIVQERKALQEEREKMDTLLQDIRKERGAFEEEKKDICKKLEEAERASRRPVFKIIGTSSTGSSSETSKSSNKSDELPPPHLPNTPMVDLGRGVSADADVWGSTISASTKEMFAHLALVAVFGQNAPYYRIRTPRRNDAKLRIIPKYPPILTVLSCYYSKWLHEHTELLDEREKQTGKKRRKSVRNHDTTSDSDTDGDGFLEDQLAENRWKEMLETETSKERDKRRKAAVDKLVKQLPSLLGDQSTNMYRNLNGREKQELVGKEGAVENSVDQNLIPEEVQKLDSDAGSDTDAGDRPALQIDKPNRPIVIAVPHAADMDNDILSFDENDENPRQYASWRNANNIADIEEFNPSVHSTEKYSYQRSELSATEAEADRESDEEQSEVGDERSSSSSIF